MLLTWPEVISRFPVRTHRLRYPGVSLGNVKPSCFARSSALMVDAPRWIELNAIGRNTQDVKMRREVQLMRGEMSQAAQPEPLVSCAGFVSPVGSVRWICSIRDSRTCFSPIVPVANGSRRLAVFVDGLDENQRNRPCDMKNTVP